MPTTDEQLDEKRQRNEKLRESLAAEEAKRVERATLASNDVTALQLDAEATRLEAQLAAAKEANKAAAVKEGAAAPLEAAKADLNNAQTFAKEQERLRAAQADAAQQAKADAANDNTQES